MYSHAQTAGCLATAEAATTSSNPLIGPVILVILLFWILTGDQGPSARTLPQLFQDHRGDQTGPRLKPGQKHKAR